MSSSFRRLEKILRLLLDMGGGIGLNTYMTTTASRLFASDLHKGQTIRFTDNAGTKIRGTIKMITAPNRRTGFRKITLTTGQVTFVDPRHTIFSA